MNGRSILTLLDLDGDGSATMSAPTSSSIYSAQIDGTTERTLFDDPTTLSLTPVHIEVASFSGETTGQAVTTSIGIRHHFVISNGDQATVNGRFEVVPEPTSAALAMLGIFGFGLIGRKR